MKTHRGAWLAVVLGAVLAHPAGAAEAAAMTATAAGRGPNWLGAYDAVTGRGDGLEGSLIPADFPVETFDGHRLRRIERTRTVPVEIRHGQQQPEFPLVPGEPAGQAEEIALRLKVLDKDKKGVDPKKDEEFLIVLKLYDMGCQGTFGAVHFQIWGHGSHPYKPRTSVTGVTSGSHWAREPLHRVCLREKTYLLPKAFLDGHYGGFDIEIRVHTALLLQEASVYRKDEALYGRHEAELRRMTLRQFELVKRRGLADDRSFQADRLLDYLAGFRPGESQWTAGARQALAQRRQDVLTGFLDVETAVDEFYYRGRVAVAQVRAAEVDRLAAAVWTAVKALDDRLDRLEQTTEEATVRAYESLRRVPRAYWFAPLRTSPEPAAFHGRKVNPFDRVQIVDASGYGDHVVDFNRHLKSLGVTYRHTWHLQGALEADGSFTGAQRQEEAFLRDILDETAVGNLTFRHFFILPADLPQWFVDKYEKTEDIWAWNGAGEVKGMANAFNDRVIEYFRQYHRRTAELFARLPNYNMPQVGAEAMQFLVRNGGCENGYSPSARRKFRAYLKDKYGSIQALNQTLGTTYESFDRIEPPPDMAIKLRRQAGPLDYDFERFRRTALVNILKDAAEAFRAVNPELLIWFESMGRFDLTAPHGLDTYGCFQVGGIASTHAQGDFNRLWNMSVHRYVQGAVYGKQEYIPSESAAHGNPATEWLYAANAAGFFLELLCGNRGLGAWNCTFVNRRASEYYGPYLYDGRGDLQPFRAAAAVPVTRKRADLLDPLLRSVRWRHPRVGLLYSTTTQLVGWPYQEMEQEAFPIHSWLYRTGLLYFVTHEDALADRAESLGDYRVIVAPFATHTRRELDAAFIQWVREGGTLISSGPFGVFDQYGQPDLKLLKEVFGDLTVEYAADEIGPNNALAPDSIAWLRREVGDLATTAVTGWFWKVTLKERRPDTRVRLALSDGTPVLLEGRYGKGRVVFSACGLGQNGLAQCVLREVRRRVVPFAGATEPYGFVVVPLADAVGHTYVAVVNSRLDGRLRDTITIDAKVARVVDIGLDHGFPVPVRHEGLKTLLALDLAAGDATILDLGLEAEMLYEVRPVGDQPVAAPPVSRFEEALRAIEQSPLAPEARREAFALASIGKGYFSRGAWSPAERYLAQAQAVRSAPAFVRLAGDEVKARRATGAVTLDGGLEEWAGAERYALKGSATSGGAFMAMWDPQTLYVAVVVRDPELKAFGELGTGVNWRWGFDGVSIRLNPADTAGRSPHGMVDVQLEDGYNVISLEVNGRKCGYPAVGVPPANVRFAVRRIRDGYVLEAAIPARDYMILPVAGASIGFDIGLSGATGTFCRYAQREGAMFDGLRLGRLYFVEAGR